MSNGEFDGQILAEKLSKLNNSQQSIESLSHWCISYRKKAKQIVETWDKLFNSSQREQRVSFLYLANDILQNSRRKGSEFVNEFWKFLPAALRLVYDNGDEYGKKAVTRLVDIWEERKVFGSRGRSLKDEMLAKNPLSSSVSNGKSSNPIKIVKRDAHSVRIKLAVGGLPEKILTAFQSVLDQHLAEVATLNNCNDAVRHLGRIEEDVESSLTQGHQQGSAVVDELLEQENLLKQCIGQLEGAQATRSALISQLKEALQDQESKLELIRCQLQVALDQMEQASNIRMRLTSHTVRGSPATAANPTIEATKVVEQNLHSVQHANTMPQPLPTQPSVSFAPLRTTEEENKKAAAAAVAAKLAASTSSAQMLTSVLSSLVAEEAASMNGGINSTRFSSALSMFSPEKRLKLEKPISVSDVNSSDINSTSYFTPLQQQPVSTAPPASSTGLQSLSQANQMQGPFAALPPPPPPPPPLSPAAPPANQYGQPSGLVVMPYGYGVNTLPPPPPLPPHVALSLTRPAPQPPGQPQPQQPQQQQQPASGGFYRPPGIGFYGQGHQTTTPPVPRQ